MASPLQGIRVIETATFISGPFAGLMLSDLGAEVVKVEPPSGDPGWRFGLKHEGLSAMGLNVNRGKQSRRLDLKSEAGREELLRLLEEADVFLHNWRPGVAERLGLDGPTLCERFPRLVYVSVNGYGADGPRAGGPVFDGLLQVSSGLAAYEGTPGRPRLPRSYLADKVAAAFVAQGVLAGLLSRATTGRGGPHEVSMLDAMAYFNFPDLCQHRTFRDLQPDLEFPPSTLVATADGWLALSPVRGSQLAATVTALGHPEWVQELKEAPTPAAVIGRMVELIEPELARRTTRECEELFREAEVPAAAVASIDEHLQDPQSLHNRLYGVMDTPSGPARWVRYPLRVDGERLDAPVEEAEAEFD